jgi:hypothetical protein
MSRGRQGDRGQAMPLVLGAMVIVVIAIAGVTVLAATRIAAGGVRVAADLAALSAGRALLDALPSAMVDPWDVRRRLLAATGDAARASAEASGARVVDVQLVSDGPVPTGVQVRVRRPAPLGLSVTATARAGIAASASMGDGGPMGWATGGGYRGPLVYRDSKPMCPATAAAFDQMDRAAHAAGLDLVVVSGFRSDAEQAVLFARHPDPKWVAPPGRSRHRNATELDLDVSSGVYPWLVRHANAFGFVQRYSWENWHWGFTPGCGAGQPGATAVVTTSLPAWVPARYRSLITSAAQAAGVTPVLLAALLEAESGFDPRAVSPAGAEGIAQFMPSTAAGMGVRDPFDPGQAIPGAARLIASGIREFGSVPLALAAYNAGGGAVHRYGGIPPYPETRAYVARIMARAGQGAALAGPGQAVVLVRAGDLLA